MVTANQSSPRLLWRPVDLLLGRGRVPASDAITVDQFHRFFTDKVDAVHAATAGGPPPTFSAAPTVFSFSCFHKVTVDDVTSAICQLPDKSCVADTLPTPQLKTCCRFGCSIFDGAIQSLAVNSHCAESVQVSAHHATTQKARLSRSTVLPTDFQLIDCVQAS